MLSVRELRWADQELLLQHFERHFAESGAGDESFLPFEPGSRPGGAGAPGGMKSDALSIPTSRPGWQRWYAAFTEGEERIVGHVDLKADGLETGLHRCELGIGIELDYRGAGLGRRLMQKAIDLAREAENLTWLDLRVFAHNSAARELYRRLGFVELGTLQDRFRIGGASVDDVIMTLRVD